MNTISNILRFLQETTWIYLVNLSAEVLEGIRNLEDIFSMS